MKNSSIQWNLLSILATLCTLWVWKAHTHRDTSDTIVNDTGGSENHSVGSDTALLSESLKNIVRSRITNQDNIDKKAISEELVQHCKVLASLGCGARTPLWQPTQASIQIDRLTDHSKYQSAPSHLKFVCVQCVKSSLFVPHFFLQSFCLNCVRYIF